MAGSPDDPRVALWHALRLGPWWAERAPPAADQAAAVASATGPVDARAVPEPAVAREAPEEAVATGVGDPAGPPAAGSPDAATVRRATIARADWAALERAVAGCTACGLAPTRTRTVFGVGHPQAHWVIVGEAPGAEEDAQGEPFVGQAGRLLDQMLASVGRSRTAATAEQAVYIANVLKCRPPGNRNPAPEEVACCEPFLLRQLALLQPRLVLVMGRFAAQSLLGTDAPIAALRGRAHDLTVGGRRVPVVVTYHPAYLLRNLADKSKAWVDLCLAGDVYQRVQAAEGR